MKKAKSVRLWLTVLAVICLLAVSAMATWGVNNDFSDGLLLTMKLVGGAGAAAFLSSAALAVWEIALTLKAKKK